MLSLAPRGSGEGVAQGMRLEVAEGCGADRVGYAVRVGCAVRGGPLGDHERVSEIEAETRDAQGSGRTPAAADERGSLVPISGEARQGGRHAPERATEGATLTRRDHERSLSWHAQRRRTPTRLVESASLDHGGLDQQFPDTESLA